MSVLPVTQSLIALTPLLLVAQGEDPLEQTPEEPAWGHSAHGPAYDDGPRQRPWLMPGIGSTPFPITSSVPEVQAWFDQGVAHLHGFWWYEAERAFRWCLKLDPECAMAYWGLARATRGERAEAFLAEASARKHQVTERERGFIEVEELADALDEAEGEDERARAREALGVRLDQLVMDHPEDVEAKLLHWHLAEEVTGEGQPPRLGQEALLQAVLDIDPDHVGALHYRVHTWDGEQGHYAIDSCRALSELAPGSGHLQHMPGHVLSGIGAWHEAAIAMDAATRVEKDYMHQRGVLPEDNWDYIHNLDYLTYIQEQLGLFDEALLSAKQLAASPAPVPQEGTGGALFTMMRGGGGYARFSLLRTLMKTERWQLILSGELLEWDPSSPADRMTRAYAEGHAHLGLEDLESARASLASYREALDGMSGERPPLPPSAPPGAARFMERFFARFAERADELEALIAIREGEGLASIHTPTELAEAQAEHWSNDPPHEPWFLYNKLGEELLRLGSPGLAAEAFERTLETVFHDGFALSGLVQAYHALGREREAGEAMAALRAVWSEADPDNRWFDAARATGVRPQAVEEGVFAAVMEQRSYRAHSLDRLGSSLYVPPPAPELEVLNAVGETVSLLDYEGRNVLLVFYLGDECLHCMEQIAAAEEHFDELQDLDCDVLAVSKDSLEELAEYEESDEFRLTLLHDPNFENATRFGAYDEFEEIELHATLLIDPSGRIHWARRGGEPFMNFDYLLSELGRMNEEGVVGRVLSAEVR